MADPVLTIPDEVRKKHPELIEFILASESMNNEERQYWINILPIMTPPQIQNLRDILENEKRQLQSIDRKYSKEIAAIGEKQLLSKMEEERKKRRTQRSTKEQQYQQEEAQEQNALLRKISEQ